MEKITNEELIQTFSQYLGNTAIELEAENEQLKKQNETIRLRAEADLDQALLRLAQAYRKIDNLKREQQQLQDDYWKLEHAIEECGGECHHALEE